MLTVLSVGINPGDCVSIKRIVFDRYFDDCWFGMCVRAGLLTKCIHQVCGNHQSTRGNHRFIDLYARELRNNNFPPVFPYVGENLYK